MNNKGFTLIEIIIVIVILGILATLAVPRITGQMESSRAAEAMQMFGALRRSATDCLNMSGGAADACVTQAQLGVSIPTTAAGAAFIYTADPQGGANRNVEIRAFRTIGGVPNAICMLISGDGTGNVTGTGYGIDPANSAFAGIVARANTGAGATTFTACAAAGLTNTLNL